MAGVPVLLCDEAAVAKARATDTSPFAVAEDPAYTLTTTTTTTTTAAAAAAAAVTTTFVGDVPLDTLHTGHTAPS